MDAQHGARRFGTACVSDEQERVRHMRSNELAKLAGVTTRTLRHYHAIGLLEEPPRSANGYRDYDAAALLRVLRIRQLASLGFHLDQVAGMLDELDAERGADAVCAAPHDGPRADELLAELDVALESRIEDLRRQRALIARLRAHDLAADFPERAAGALAAMDRLARLSDVPGFMNVAFSDADRLAMGIAAHLYTEEELAEIERVFTAIVERGMVGEYRRVSVLVNDLPADADEPARSEAVAACLGFLEQLSDCFAPGNWLREDKDYELLLDRTASAAFNGAQIDVSNRVFEEFARRMEARA